MRYENKIIILCLCSNSFAGFVFGTSAENSLAIAAVKTAGFGRRL